MDLRALGWAGGPVWMRWMTGNPGSLIAVLVTMVALLSGCTVEAGGPVDIGRPTTPSTAPPTGPDPQAIRTARDVLGQPMVGLADALLSAAAAVDRARHEVPRGEQAVEASIALGTSLDALREAAVTADQAARSLEGEDRIDRARELVTTVAAAGVRSADAGAAQAAALQGLGQLDARMDAAVRSWEAPGSQSQRRAALGALALELEALAEEAAVEQPVPGGCPQMRDARERWAGLLAERTRALQEVATGGSGDVYDARLAEFTADPYGENRLAVDADTRSCWADQSELARTAVGITPEVQALEALLQS